MEIKTIESFLLNYFNEIRWVSTDIVTDEIINITKENGVVKTNTIKQTFNMRSLLSLSLEDVNRLLHLEINSCDKINIKTNIISRFLGKIDITINNDEWMITSNEVYNKYYSKSDFNVYLADDFKDLIVVGNKSIRLLIHEDLTKFYIDYKSLKVYKI